MLEADTEVDIELPQRKVRRKSKGEEREAESERDPGMENVRPPRERKKRDREEEDISHGNSANGGKLRLKNSGCSPAHG